MTSPHGRRLQTRRALAILTWATLTVCAWLLWYGQRKDIIRIQAWEPAALVLSAYATFLSIFGWMLFSPGNRSAEESPGLFFSGMLTLIPPCFIAYNLMPDNSPLRPWLTIGVFLFGILAIMSPLPKEVFAVPRDRRSYLQPLTDAYLSELNTDAPEIRFDNLLPKTQFWLTQPEEDTRQRETARDPWADPFYGTGRQMSRVGVSQSRRNEPGASDLAAVGVMGYSAQRIEPQEPPRFDANRSNLADDRQNRAAESSPRGASITMPQTGSRRPLTEPGQPKSAPFPAIVPVNVPSLPVPGPTGFVPPASTARDMAPPPLPRNVPPASHASALAPPLNSPSKPSTTSPMGFQSPGQSGNRPSISPSQPITPSPMTRPAGSSSAAAPVRPLSDGTPPSIRPLSTDTIATLASGMLGGQVAAAASTAAAAASAPAVAKLTETTRPLSDSIEARAAEVRSIVESVQRTESPAAPQAFVDRGRTDVPRSLPSTTPVSPVAERPSPSLQELDRQLRELEAEEEAELKQQTATSARATPARSTQSNGDVTMERIADEHGGEMIEGTIKVFFEVGQKRAHLHVPFTPPLGGMPEVECEPAHDDGVRVKVAVRQPYGIRIEARRTEAAEALRSEVSFAAVFTKK